MPCSGNHSEFCGGPDRLNVYSAAATPPDSGCSPVFTSYGMLQNGGFEAGFAGWTPNIVMGTFSPALNTIYNFEGCDAV